MATNAWQTVQRRRSRAAPPSGVHHPPPRQAAQLMVYSQQPTYAQVVQRGNAAAQQQRQPPHQQQQSSVVPQVDARPAQGVSSQQTVRQLTRRTPPRNIVSPESTTNLRYPPSPTYSEWRSRCFRCFRKGHLSSECTNARRCATCWGQGHDFAECPRGHHGRRRESVQVLPARQQTQQEPDYAELLDAPDSSVQTIMPPDSERPERIFCYISRDSQHFEEVRRLSAGLVVTLPADYEIDLPLDDVAHYVASTGLVTPNQLSIGAMTRGRYLVLLPSHVSALDIAMAFPENWWELGFTASIWSPLIDAEVSIPRYKVWMQVVGAPPHVWREEYMVQLASQFGAYLGGVQVNDPGNLSHWDMVVATPDLRRIPRAASFEVGGLSYSVNIVVRRWRCVPVYSSANLPPPPPHVTRPSQRSPPQQPSPTSSEDIDCRVDGDTIVLNIRSMREIFRHVNSAELPEDIARVLRDGHNGGQRGDGGINLSRQSLSVVAPPTIMQNRSMQQDRSKGKQPQQIRQNNKRLSSIDVRELHASVRSRGQPSADKRMCTDLASQAFYENGHNNEPHHNDSAQRDENFSNFREESTHATLGDAGVSGFTDEAGPSKPYDPYNFKFDASSEDELDYETD